MSECMRQSGKRVRLAVIMGLAGAGIPAVASAQPELQGAGLALDLLERLQYTRAGADGITASLSLVEFEPKYCLPPDTPNKDRDRDFLRSRDKALDQYVDRYRTLRPQLLNLIANDGHARRAVEAKFPDANPVAASFWQPWQDAFNRARKAIRDKRDELERIKEEPCHSMPESQVPEPPKPPEGPGVDLPEVKVRPVEIPPIPERFCTAEEKQTVLNQFYAVQFDFYLNYQDAREYHDAIAEAIARGHGNASVLRAMQPVARQNMDFHAKRDDEFHQALDRVRAMPVVDCREREQTARPDSKPLTPPDYVPFVFPAVPDRFCTQGKKDATRGYLESARNVARWNHDQAAAWVTGLGDRIAKGDQSPAAGAAFQEANAAASAWLKQSQDLDGTMRQAEAMPVVECAPEPGSTAPRVASGSSIRFGITVAKTYFPDFERTVGDQPGITEASASNSPIYVGAIAELNLSQRLRLGWSVYIGRHDFTQVYPSGSFTGTVNGLFVDTRLIYVQPVYGINLLAGGGITYARNELHDFLDAVRNLPLADRTHNGVKSSFGVAAEVPVGRGFAGRGGVDYTTSFRSGDADAHWRMGVAVIVDF